MRLQRQYDEVRSDPDELSREFNETVSETLFQRGEVFTRRATGMAALLVGSGDGHTRLSEPPASSPGCAGRGDAEGAVGPLRRSRAAPGLVAQRDGGSARELAA
ncbi:hypothetical protein AB0D30_21675 [Streptomyces sp. NPDC048409]|uniref:hypothetical protein n=1 Tax=Streptomyces sp. NPDC048409 TaxID=3154723 RepID=UPI00342D7973